MIFYLTFQAYRNKTKELIFTAKAAHKFDNKVKSLKLTASDVKEYVWSIDRVAVKQQEDLFGLSESCKIALYIIFFGDGCCFDLSKCSLKALNIIFTTCYYRHIGVILDTPYLIHSIVSPNYIMDIDFEGVYISEKAETPFELFSAGAKDLCYQLEKNIKTPILMNVYDNILQTNIDINNYAKELEEVNKNQK